MRAMGLVNAASHKDSFDEPRVGGGSRVDQSSVQCRRGGLSNAAAEYTEAKILVGQFKHLCARSAR